MIQRFLLFLILLVAFVDTLGYWFLLPGWLANLNLTLDKRQYSELFLSTFALIIYLYLAIRFIRSKLPPL